MLDLTGYTLGSNQPLTNARILWDFAAGDISGTGQPELAANDYTHQRWQPDDGATADWTVEFDAATPIDMVLIAAHNLSGACSGISIATQASAGGAWTTRATLTQPTDDRTIVAMFNTGAGAVISAWGLRVRLSTAAGATVGIIRAGQALQMTQPVLAGVAPLGLNRRREMVQTLSERGAFLGRTEKYWHEATTMQWQHLKADWYRSTFEPFARVLPRQPFGLVQNPLRMPESVGWCWTNDNPAPEYMGLKGYMQVSLGVTGFGGA